ncbi:hypothetical protein [Clavibacter capsici]|uniref:Lipoprotein n=1 Tax=Clavibacter capsici TaxID=1874630 RepID=A0AAE7CCC7_9MICO|nr:hypothetical protein [Clavibacter capsici]ALD13418.1 hypothetical protein AES38_11210 [Clavibacter capsici]QIS39753.1 hypothetical protein GW572_11615 [Clavibacter capsici]QIS45613.1 hypothetical protein GW570_11190 [Clavibacter capsici]
MTPAASPRRSARVGTALALGAVTLALAGCSSVMDDVADIYAITYEVTTTGPAADGLTDVSYAEASHRGRPSIVKEVGQASFAPGDDSASSIWSIESVVTAEDWAFVQATPMDGEALTCRILVDGVKEIASSTAAPGQPVTCQVPTAPFG